MMHNVRLGKVGVTSIGTWKPGIYKRNTMATVNGQTYMTRHDKASKNPEEDIEQTDWVLIAARGESLYQAYVRTGRFTGTEKEFLDKYQLLLTDCYNATEAARTATDDVRKALEQIVTTVNTKMKEAGTAIGDCNEATRLSREQTGLANTATGRANTATGRANTAANNADDMAEKAKAATASTETSLLQFNKDKKTALDTFTTDSSKMLQDFGTEKQTALENFSTESTTAINNLNTAKETAIQELNTAKETSVKETGEATNLAKEAATKAETAATTIDDKINPVVESDKLQNERLDSIEKKNQKQDEYNVDQDKRIKYIEFKAGISPAKQWKEGDLIAKDQAVLMHGETFVAKVATRNPPMGTMLDESGNRLMTADGGYILSGEYNLAEYDKL